MSPLVIRNYNMSSRMLLLLPLLLHVLIPVILLLSPAAVTAFVFVPTVPTASTTGIRLHKVIPSCSTVTSTAVSSSPWFFRRIPAIQTQLLASTTTKQKDNDIESNSNNSDTVPSELLLEEVLRVAIDASKKAGEIILGNAGGAEVTQRKANSRDLLTLIDPLCEKTIKTTILDAFPNHAFLGEEDVPPGKDASAAAIDDKLKTSSCDWLWIVDPIDGTTNFVHGMPLNMPSIAVAYKGEVVVGVINDPHRKEVFTATKGGGSFLNGKLIEVGPQNELGDAVVAMGSPPAEESLKMSLIGVQALMPKVRTIRMLGSAAIMLAWIANGRLTAYWEYDLRLVYSIINIVLLAYIIYIAIRTGKDIERLSCSVLCSSLIIFLLSTRTLTLTRIIISSWDIAAGALIIKEAGGNFTDLAGDEFTLRTRKIVASNGMIHDELLSVLNDAGVV